MKNMLEMASLLKTEVWALIDLDFARTAKKSSHLLVARTRTNLSQKSVAFVTQSAADQTH